MAPSASSVDCETNTKEKKKKKEEEEEEEEGRSAKQTSYTLRSTSA